MSKITIAEFIQEEIDELIAFKVLCFSNFDNDNAPSFIRSEWFKKFKSFVDVDGIDGIKLLNLIYYEYENVASYANLMSRNTLKEIQNVCSHNNIKEPNGSRDFRRCLDCGKILKDDI